MNMIESIIAKINEAVDRTPYYVVRYRRNCYHATGYDYDGIRYDYFVTSPRNARRCPSVERAVKIGREYTDAAFEVCRVSHVGCVVTGVKEVKLVERRDAKSGMM